LLERGMNTDLGGGLVLGGDAAVLPGAWQK
jgi:hypothetical protein